MEAVHADWKEYLNLLICEESHLKYMEDYHQVPASRGHCGSLTAHLAPLRAQHRFPPGAFQAAFPRLPTSVVLMVDMHVPQDFRALVCLPWGWDWRVLTHQDSAGAGIGW